jgi:hypothetical protein
MRCLRFSGVRVSFGHVQPLQTTVLHYLPHLPRKKCARQKASTLRAEASSTTTQLTTRGMLQKMHVVAGEHRYCEKQFRRTLEQGPVDHENDFKCKVPRKEADPGRRETLRQLAEFSERQIRKETRVRRDTIRLIRHGKGVKRSTYARIINFLKE